MKLFHNKFIGKALAVLFGVGAAGYLAWTFSYFGAWVGSTFLDQTLPGAALTLTIFCAIVMALAVLYVFFYIEYAKEDVEAYEYDRGDGSFIKAFRGLKRGVLGLELFSLLFRFVQLLIMPGSWAAHLALGLAMAGVGFALLYLAHLFGKTLHAQVNRPYEVEAERLSNDAGNEVINKSRKHFKRLGVDQLRRVANGDFSALDDVRDADEQERIDEANERAQKRADWQARKGKAKSAMTKFLQPRDEDPTPAPLELPGSNGHNKRPANF